MPKSLDPHESCVIHTCHLFPCPYFDYCASVCDRPAKARHIHNTNERRWRECRNRLQHFYKGLSWLRSRFGSRLLGSSCNETSHAASRATPPPGSHCINGHIASRVTMHPGVRLHPGSQWIQGQRVSGATPHPRSQLILGHSAFRVALHPGSQCIQGHSAILLCVLRSPGPGPQ